MEKLVKEWRGRPPIGKTFKERDAGQKWVYGVVSTDAQDTPEVLLTDGTVASQDKIEGEIRDIPFTHNPVRVECRELQSQTWGRDPSSTQSPLAPPRDPSTLILSRPPCYIVGWTLSIRTERPGTRTFSVKSGGILESKLTIDIKAPAFHRAYWRCRIYLVDKADYNFPHLTSK